MSQQSTTSLIMPLEFQIYNGSHNGNESDRRKMYKYEKSIQRMILFIVDLFAIVQRIGFTLNHYQGI